jgi:RecT family
MSTDQNVNAAAATPEHDRPADAPYLPAVVDATSPAFMTRPAPLIDSLPDRWVSYLAHNIAQCEGDQGVTRAEVGLFVELCATYQLDPFAKEAWLAKSRRGKLLVMVGRDGLRKIAQRNGLHVDGDVVRTNDDFAIVRSADGNRTVAHGYGKPSDRGDIVGAWAEAREGGPLGRPMGFFFAPLGEYRPANASEYSPWSKQTSVMILAAAERQAIRQGTPLGGLVAFGEHESAWARETSNDLTAGDGNPELLAPIDLPAEVEVVVARAEALGHRGVANRQTAAMAVIGQAPEVVEAKVHAWTVELDRMEAEARERPVSSEPARAGEDTPQGQDGPQAPGTAGEASRSGPPLSAAEIKDHEADVMVLLNDADVAEAAGDLELAERKREGAGRIIDELDAARDPGTRDIEL